MLTLAVGIAGTTVMFALIQGVLLRPLPVRDQDRVLVAWKTLRSMGFAHGRRRGEAYAISAFVLRSARLLRTYADSYSGKGCGSPGSAL